MEAAELQLRSLQTVVNHFYIYILVRTVLSLSHSISFLHLRDFF